jgi:3'(2'), 5'-bisphosphate nucleotidase
MNFDLWQHECDVALGAVREAAILARDIRKQIGTEALLKADRSPVTVADFAVQAIVARRLGDAFPGDPVVAEEDSASLRTPQERSTLASVVKAVQRVVPGVDQDDVLAAIDRGTGSPSERFWTLDPVDGTQGFVRGDQYVVALALIVRGRVKIGMLGCPQLALSPADFRAPADDRQRNGGSLVFAVRNQGAFRSPLAGGEFTRLHVSSRSEPRLARVLRSVERDHIDLAAFNEIFRTLAVEVPPVLMDSQAKHAVIAAGEADLLLRLPARSDFRDKIWDQAAGAIIVEEAGGRVTDVRGADLDFGVGRTLLSNEGCVASNGHVHTPVIEAFRRLDSRRKHPGQMTP